MPKLVELGLEYHAVFGDPQGLSQVQSLLDAEREEPLAHETQRTLALLRNEFLRHQEDEASARRRTELETEIANHYTNFRAQVNGASITSNDIRDVLRSATDSSIRRSHWEASKQIGPRVEPLVRELVELRNSSARAMGYRDFYDRQMQTQEIDEAELYGLLNSLEQRTREPFSQAKSELDARLRQRFGLAESEPLYPWHYEDPFFQEAPDISGQDYDALFQGADLEKLTADTFARCGLDIRLSLANSDLYEREGKDQGAFCLVFGRDPQKVHVLCNCRDNADWAATMLHEFGHAAYDQCALPSQSYLLRGIAHICSTEAIAMLFGRLTFDSAWLEDVLGLSAGRASELSASAAKQLRLQMLIFTRWMMVMTAFERALYADPSQDLNKLWWDLAERYQQLTRPPGRDMPDWACKSHIAEAPVYYHNYMLGEMMASQIQHHIENRLGSVPMVRQAQTGPWLRSGLFEQGALRPWNEALEHLCGERLDPAYFLAQFVDGPAAQSA